ncbi:hypothetical protein MSAR_33330 [Mycolicibacterium sarraceniae]|uniref:Uncharacterized protein n=1 Tax=Mycolicibacterium sarraceniae TaxID=1534348 RepID=A0A7I7ST74_9MYCO|nr:hypothetical protein MSAR_33330 [Mycolicibacterium sarraceniae]
MPESACGCRPFVLGCAGFPDLGDGLLARSTISFTGLIGVKMVNGDIRSTSGLISAVAPDAAPMSSSGHMIGNVPMRRCRCL